jgi:putative transposase
MPKDITKAASNIFLGAEWQDSIEARVRTEIRGFIEEILEAELSTALGRARYARSAERLPVASESGPEETNTVAAQRVFGHRNGRRDRELMGTFGKTTISVPRARVETFDGGTTEWKSKTALIAGSYLAGTNTRRVGRALASLFRGAVSKDTVSRAWRKIKGDWEAWNKRDLKAEDIVRLILDGTTVRVRIDRKATTISLLIVLGVRRDGQKVLLAIRSMGGESEAAWRSVLDDLAARGLRKPDLAIVDGAPGLEKALTSLWRMFLSSGAPCTSCAI